MNVILFGSTGMVGKGVLLECLEDARVKKMLLFNRRPIDVQHEKIEEIIHNDFHDFSSFQSKIKDYDGCFFCLGVSAVGMSEEAYRRITYDITMAFANVYAAANPNGVFCYVSGASTDSSEKGRAMWARVKGKTENELLKLPFKGAYMFRPGYIQPLKGIRSSTGWYQFFYTVMKPLYFLLKPMKKYVTDSVTLGKAMIEVADKGYGKRLVESKDINELGR